MKRTLLLMLLAALALPAEAQTVQIKDGWYYLDGRKCFIKGIGYEFNARPGRLPWVYGFDAELIRFDLSRIKSAGFNTIRTWSDCSEEELRLVEESGLKMLFGIWIDGAGDFRSPSFRASTLAHVRDVLSYSKKYSCIIGYLIMNEPAVDHIADAGAENLSSLWKETLELIHREHPGIPVSYSSALTGDFISQDMFDFTAYNAYCYNPVTISASHGYAGFLRALKSRRAADQPLLVTEFGLSVSPGVPALAYTYGGNTLEKQASGDLFMYRGLIDAGASGGCVFQYHDGWWKGGNEFAHNDSPEEWFGLVAFSGLTDRYGSVRPAWQAMAAYNTAIITEPKNEGIYGDTIPIELFLNDTVSSFAVKAHGAVLLDQALDSGYFCGSLPLTLAQPASDLLLTFQFFDHAGSMLKEETISLLASNEAVHLPSISMQVAPAALNPGARHALLIDVEGDPFFTIEGSGLDIAAHPHIGYDNGMARYRPFVLEEHRASLIEYFDIPAASKAATFGAGFTIRHGTFTKRIAAERIMTAGTWADAIKASDPVTSVDAAEAGARPARAFHLYQNYPNPFNPSSVIRFDLSEASMVSLKVFDLLGREVATLYEGERQPGRYEAVLDAARLSAGVYIYRLQCGRFMSAKTFSILK
ncbi:MAG: T9SS type A sorting domain-containing protein [Acidobacteriota bacterium]